MNDIVAEFIAIFVYDSENILFLFIGREQGQFHLFSFREIGQPHAYQPNGEFACVGGREERACRLCDNGIVIARFDTFGMGYGFKIGIPEF